MAMQAILTTKATRWSQHLPDTAPQWTDRNDGFFVTYGENETPPIQTIDVIAAAGQDGGVVTKCQCTTDQRMVAVKRMDTASDEVANRKLANEVGVLRVLKHYHSVRILGSYTHKDWFNIIMEPVADCDLRTYLQHDTRSHKVRSLEDDCGSRMAFLPKIMGCLANGLRYIHKDTKVRHRDIKPANILLYRRRVLFADFGISKIFTETHSGTTGPSSKTQMYTSPERKDEEYRNKSDDIFSLGCVFAEIYTVYKGYNLDVFYQKRRDADPEKDGYYHRTIETTLAWLTNLITERCDVQIVRLLRAMLDVNGNERPDAETVWKTLTVCTTGSNQYFCGPCCMPLLNDDPILERMPFTDPASTSYTLPVDSRNIARITRDLRFQTDYGRHQDLGLDWIRNLRHWPHSILDVVQLSNESPHYLARKRITALDYAEGALLAMNEAEILRTASHHHIVRLYSTYRQGDIYGLLYDPAADYDLRSYIEMHEINSAQGKTLPADARLLIKSFGCLANALARVHEAGYDHGDIRPENVLVNHGNILLSKFSLGLKIEQLGTPTFQRIINMFGKFDIGTSRNTSTNSEVTSQKPTDPTAGYYQPPEWRSEQHTSFGQPKADIFALGCVFLEIYTALSGRTLAEFRHFRTDSLGRTEYRHTVSRCLQWIQLLEEQDYESKTRFQNLLKLMIAEKPEDRPPVKDIHTKLRHCKTSNGRTRCGEVCCP